MNKLDQIKEIVKIVSEMTSSNPDIKDLMVKTASEGILAILEKPDVTNVVTVVVSKNRESYCFVNLPDNIVEEIYKKMHPDTGFSFYKVRFRKYFISREVYTFSDIEGLQPLFEMHHIEKTKQ